MNTLYSDRIFAEVSVVDYLPCECSYGLCGSLQAVTEDIFHCRVLEDPSHHATIHIQSLPVPVGQQCAHCIHGGPG